jgi:hypothetical protein
MKGDKKKNSAALAGMKLMERRLLGKKLLNNQAAAFPPFSELRKKIGERTNINVDSPTHLLEKMLNHTAEDRGLERELNRLREKLSSLNKDIPVLQEQLDTRMADDNGKCMEVVVILILNFVRRLKLTAVCLIFIFSLSIQD